MTIRWPWVSRATSDRIIDDANLLVRSADRQIIDGQERELRWESRYNDLLTRYHMLKLQGFSEPTAPAEPRPVVPPDPIKRAIAQRAGTNRQLRENMERQVTTDRLLGKSDEEILSAIIAGVSGEDLILSEAGLMSP